MALVHERRRQALDAFQIEQILEGFASCIQERGYAATTTADIARAARVSKSTIYQYFDDKEAVYLRLHAEVADRMAATLQAAVEETRDLPTWSERGRMLTARYLDGMASDAKYLMQVLAEPASTSPATRHARAQAGERFSKIYVSFSRELAESFQDVDILTPARAVAVLVASIELIQAHAHKGAEAVRALEDDLTDLLVRLLQAPPTSS
jgi:AcrR family transcriptional regulator